MLTKWRPYLSFQLAAIIITFLGIFFFSQPSFAGSRFSEQGNALSEALYDDLIKKRICPDSPTCFRSLQMYGEDSKRIYLNMYGQKDTVLASKVASFLVEKGFKVTGGIPITLKVFPEPKTQYLGLFRAIFGNNDEILKLEINK